MAYRIIGGLKPKSRKFKTKAAAKKYFRKSLKQIKIVPAVKAKGARVAGPKKGFTFKAPVGKKVKTYQRVFKTRGAVRSFVNKAIKRSVKFKKVK